MYVLFSGAVGSLVTVKYTVLTLAIGYQAKAGFSVKLSQCVLLFHVHGKMAENQLTQKLLATIP